MWCVSKFSRNWQLHMWSLQCYKRPVLAFISVHSNRININKPPKRLVRSSSKPHQECSSFLWGNLRLTANTIGGVLGSAPGQLYYPLQWRHNGRDSVLNHKPHDCLLNLLFRRGSKKTSKLRVTGLCAGNSPVTGEFPAQMASDTENVSIWWRHHGSTFIIVWYNTMLTVIQHEINVEVQFTF